MLKKFCSENRKKGKLQSWRKYLQTAYPAKGYYLEYVKNYQEPTVK